MNDYRLSKISDAISEVGLVVCVVLLLLLVPTCHYITRIADALDRAHPVAKQEQSK